MPWWRPFPGTLLPGLLPEALRSEPPFAGLAQIRSSPIVSVELWLDRVVVDHVFVGLRDSEVEWVFDKGRLFGRAGAPQHLSFIVSAAYRSSPKPNAELRGRGRRRLAALLPGHGGGHRDAVAGHARARGHLLGGPRDGEPSARRPSPRSRGLVLAGDWTATGLPATIEGAVRSGREAARALGS